MKILFVLSQIEVTGAETYALSLADALKDFGHEIVFVSEKMRNAGPFKFYSIPLHSKNTSTLGRLSNILALRKIISTEKIELIHSHSRAANLVCHFAKGSKVPLVVTIHGRWRNHFAARVLPCLGNKTIAICPYLERYLAADLKRPKGTIRMVPNGIDTQQFIPVDTQAQEQKILFVGRFSGQKGNVIRYLLSEIFPKILQRFRRLSIQIAALSPTENDRGLVRSLNGSFQRKAVEILDWTDHLPPLYQQATLVVGSGRVALEAMASAKPVVAIGESSAPGLISKANFNVAFDSNFGDCGEWNLFLKGRKLVEEISQVLTNSGFRQSVSVWSRQIALEKFDSKKVAKAVEKIYLEKI